MTELTTINTNNYAEMARAMGIASEGGAKKKANTLNRLRIWHSPIMGQDEVKGKMKNVEVIEGGMYRLEVIKDDTSTFVFSKTVNIRPFMQRFMYRRYIANTNPKAGEPKGVFHRTIMANTLSTDLKDNMGTFNCGKPTGFVEDFKALPQTTQDLIRQIKRVRVVFGIASMIDPVDENGNKVVLENTPFIWEIDNKDAYKTIGDQFSVFSKKERLPLQHIITLRETKQNPLPNGSSFYTPVANIDLSIEVPIEDADHNTFSDFMDWVKNYNTYIYKEWDEKAHAKQNKLSDEDEETLSDFIDVEVDEDAA